ncbi:MAG: hypothetical protein LBS54_06000 [Dysgonamonadaceae bacterium]|jgi:hypothetical protein|nr:hypothetical protein [Dysgonamonadaceae bacterium]
MDAQNVTLNLSGIKFSLDNATQEQIVNDVINAVMAKIEISLANLIKDVTKNLSEAKDSQTISNAGQEIPEIPNKKRRGRPRKVADTETTPILKDVDAKPEKKIVEHKEIKDGLTEKIHSDVTIYKGYQAREELFNELGFKTLFDVLAFKFTKTGKVYDQEQFNIDAFLNDSRLKVFASQAKVKKYVLGLISPKKANKAEKKETVALPVATGTGTASLIEGYDASKTLKKWCGKQSLITIGDALKYCNEVKLKATIEEGINKHSMVYQLVKFLCTSGFESRSLMRFLDKIDGGEKSEENIGTSQKSGGKIPDTNIITYNQNIKEPENAEEKEFRSVRYHTLTEEENNALYTLLDDYPFSDFLKEEVFKKHKIKSIFELLFWFCGITRSYVAEQFELEKAILIRMETILAENGFIDPIDKMESMSYAYRSKYYHYIRYYRNKIINNKLFINKYNKGLIEEEIDNLYKSVEDLGLSEKALTAIRYNKITTVIGLKAFMYYGCDTAYPKQFTEDVVRDIFDTIKENGLQKHNYNEYMKGLRGYYYKSSLYIQKRKQEQGTEVMVAKAADAE